VCFEDISARDKNKRDVLLMCIETVCTDMMMMGCVCVSRPQPKVMGTVFLLLLLLATQHGTARLFHK
jgi:hypothetical protein